ncbi:hypothetical protein RYX56_10915 [Alkalihalophilus lindianensis]|uniref:Uncharacterized protein n=1 Tax=Alkalihalophilus lindianensis TaxID=1630542 RepID=A0ABU3XAF5_9BACI|nr:hypothetical protein [Alkalihalophilus lindianensis]MDV2684879.1 hypothetical protein [Alkalihalophilus lindianensis]
MMELVDWLKAQYGFKQVEFINEAVILTDQGRKRIRSWSDSSLLEWHVEWRDRCHYTPIVLTDRMIRTKEEEAAAKWKEQWITLHDEIEEVYPQLDHEKAWGMLMGLMITHGLEERQLERVYKEELPSYEWNPMLLNGLRDDIQDQLIRYHKEALVRSKKAERIRSQQRNVKQPLLDLFQSPDQARRIYEVLIWRGTNEQAHLGYQSLRQFLINWQIVNGTKSLEKVIASIGHTEGFNKDQALLFIVEVLEPYEWAALTRSLMSNESERQIEEKLTKMSNEWEAARQLVSILGRWIDDQKKVVT